MRSSKALLLLLSSLITVALVVNLDTFDKPLLPEVASVLMVHQDDSKGGQGNGEIDYWKDALGRDWQSWYSRCSSRTQTACLGLLQAELQRKPLAENQRLASLLLRYDVLLGGQSAWGEVSTQGEPGSFPWALMLQLSAIKLANASLVGPDEFFGALSTDLRFWRTVYTAGQTMMDKVVAIAGLWGNVQFLSQYLSVGGFQGLDSEAVLNLLSQADLDSSDLQPAIESELKGFADLLASDNDLALSELTGWPDWFATHFIQRQASLNLFYTDVVEPMLCLSKLSEEDVAGPEGEGAGEHNCFEQSASVGMSWFPYNLTGKRLVSGIAGGAGYIYRVHDYNALVALVRYQLAILEGRGAAPEQYLPEGRTVDKSESSLAVDCLERQSVCRIEWR